MIRVLLLIRNTLMSFLSVTTIIVITLGGCKKEKVDFQEMVDSNLHEALASLAKKTTLPPDIVNRAKTALAKLEDGTLDTKPILVLAVISLIDPNNQPIVDFVFFDENKDLRGLRIKERYINSSGSITTLEEDYPVFVNELDTFATSSAFFPIHFRDKNQRKDKYLWLEYMNRNLDELIRLNIDEQKRDVTDTRLKNMKFEKTPPIYISIPDPNRVQVEISVYDREGNESDSVELHTGLSMENYELEKAGGA